MIDNDDDYFENASPDEIVKYIADLTLNTEADSISTLQKFCTFGFSSVGQGQINITRLACRGLLYKGAPGVEALKNLVLEPIKIRNEETNIDGNNLSDSVSILEAIWYAAHGELPSRRFPESNISLIPPLNTPLTSETIISAKEAINEVVEESQLNGELFLNLLMFVNQAWMGIPDYLDGDFFNNVSGFMKSIMFELFTEPAIKITSRLINEFKKLVNDDHPEEVYQQFLSKHPVFIDPLASKVIPKQRLGIEHITDFVLQRLDNEYIVVEIEKPQDKIFTNGNDFTAKFTHAYGQVLDFQEWVDAHGEYARNLIPNISTPRGMLIMGLRVGLSDYQAAKLKRLNFNSKSVDVFTFDDLIKKATDLHRNIHKHTEVNIPFNQI